MSRMSGMNPPSQNDNPGAVTIGVPDVTNSVSVPGAKMGDFVLVSIDDDQRDANNYGPILIQGYVESPGVVRVVFANTLTANACDIGPTNIRVKVIPYEDI